MTAENNSKRFTGATRYVLDDELASIVNISMALEMPLASQRRAGNRQNDAGARHSRES